MFFVFMGVEISEYIQEISGEYYDESEIISINDLLSHLHKFTKNRLIPELKKIESAKNDN